MMGEIKGWWGDGGYYLSCVSPGDVDGRAGGMLCGSGCLGSSRKCGRPDGAVWRGKAGAVRYFVGNDEEVVSEC